MVDLRWHLLNRVKELDCSEKSLSDKMNELLTEKKDSRIKIFTFWKGLHFRKKYKELILNAEYISLEITGNKVDHIIEKKKKKQDRYVIVVSSRFYSLLLENDQSLPINECWQDNHLILPDDLRLSSLKDIYTNAEIKTEKYQGKSSLNLQKVLKYLPYSILTNSES